ncbi:hypothetical protein ASE90_09690 [Sphingomonas sp. Leaf67]|uniref:hypothetical protein n=1 Tax=Sphingomonas sp. Leaf67 TaxID=1736230 RepID=UPI0006F9CF84|nr:hypothetical protein [Sphingomonas sp. Leaf67]KQN83012.1 hypothetical protein ASE90_09690 [Sphingomonas sp. Leaf67]
MLQTTYALLNVDEIVNIEANNVIDTHYSTARRTAFVVANGDVGDDNIIGFGKTDTLITGKKIFDGNGDGFIGFGKNGLLDIDRVNARKAGNDQLRITDGEDSIGELRYLGEFGGQHAYAAAGALHQFLKEHANGVEGTVQDDVMTTRGGALFIDNALGLRIGDDIVTDFNYGSKIVTTHALADADEDGNVDSLRYQDGGKTAVFDITSGKGEIIGTITMTDSYASSVSLSDITEIGGVVYYTYTVETP